MDAIVTRIDDPPMWILTDLLGRPMGEIVEESNGFYFTPRGEAVETMLLVKRGPHRSLDKALAEIETRTRGLCSRAT